MDGIDIQLELYGILKSYVQHGRPLSLKVPVSMTLEQLKENVFSTLNQCSQPLTPKKTQDLKDLIASSAFSKKDQILEEEEDGEIKLQHNDIIAVLPPVCGG
jgi:molybdopterin converting factor small subunit